jgi:hypothetical protein
VTNSKWDAIVPGLTGVIGHQVSVIGVQNALSALGLHIIDAKDKAVLDAMSEVPYHCIVRQLQSNYRDEREAAGAELARREDP